MDGIDKEFLPTFDNGKPFGTVTPPERGAHFEQNGFYFDRDGALVEELLTEQDVARVKKAALQRQADRAAEDARKQFLADNGIDAADPDVEKKVIAAAAANADTGDVDLVAWAKAEKPYPFAKVRKAAEAQYQFQATDARALVAFMVNEGKVKEDEVKVRGA